MKQPTQQRIIKGSLSLFMLLIIQLSAFAQEKVEVNGNDVGTWFSHNWMWVTGVVVLLLLIILFSGSKNKRKSTTVVKDSTGDVRRVTTTEVEE